MAPQQPAMNGYPFAPGSGLFGFAFSAIVAIRQHIHVARHALTRGKLPVKRCAISAARGRARGWRGPDPRGPYKRRFPRGNGRLPQLAHAELEGQVANLRLGFISRKSVTADACVLELARISPHNASINSWQTKPTIQGTKLVRILMKAVGVAAVLS